MTDYLWRKGMIKFNLGQLVCTRTINEHLKNETTKKEIFSAIDKYITCDWGNLCEEDKKMNEYAIKNNVDFKFIKIIIDNISLYVSLIILLIGEQSMNALDILDILALNHTIERRVLIVDVGNERITLLSPAEARTHLMLHATAIGHRRE